ncbi:MAG: hypothetical protein OIF35_02940, partial [Cellvibrionaceae bacterium]|nr:hypothetical protein [Cellvibrionaceae bacterium]
SSSGSSSSGSSSGGSASCDYDASLLYNDAVVNISDWKKGAPLIRIPLGNDVFSYRFTTTDSDSMYGRITAGVYGGSESVGRKVWVSKCPNGAPLASAAYTYRGTQYNGCETKGTKNIAILPWYQYQKTYRCSLNTNETYYINVKHVLSDDDPNRCNRASSCQTSIEVGNNL